jgi:hypothetical protein
MRPNATSNSSQSTGEAAFDKPSLKTRVVSEAKKYAIIVVYLWALFAAFHLYRALILEDNWRDFWGQGFALVNALVFGKVILIGDALRMGRPLSEAPRIYFILARALLLAILLLAFQLMEEIVKAALQGRAVEEAVDAITGRNLRRDFAAATLYFLFLIPLLVYDDISRALGGGLWNMLFVRGEKRFKLMNLD